jgi:hypothetical protein
VQIRGVTGDERTQRLIDIEHAVINRPLITKS